ncbi:MAG: glycosyltransferase [Turicibacter sp.]|nr:glycosyltransferase [Turicibacter sp.]
MKKIIIIHSNMEIGGAETSLLGLLKAIDYKKYKVDLLLLNPTGELINMIPQDVNLLTEYTPYANLTKPILNLMKNRIYGIALMRLFGKFFANMEYIRKGKKCDLGYLTKQYSYKYCLKYLPSIEGEYDLGISFIDPHFIIQEKVKAKVTLGWLHTDFRRLNVENKTDFYMWNNCNYIISVSDACKEAFDERYPSLAYKSSVVENLLPLEFVRAQANLIDVSHEMPSEKNVINLCSVGRFSEQKNFDNIPNIARKIVDAGYKIRWYLIGYGDQEELIKNKIKEEKMENNVIVLGKKKNPYPYIKSCDIYIQPSRYEGKAVTVREAQMLNRPVIITNFSTARSQLKNGIDGLIVPIDNVGCAEGIIKLIKDSKMRQVLIENTTKFDYTNISEINKIYKFIGS